jgi:hypothetical protein
VPDQAIGRSRGGWMTKIYTLTDVIGRPYVLILTAAASRTSVVRHPL